MYPYILGDSFVMKYDVISRKGIVRALRGETSDSSPYFNALSAVTVAIAHSMDEINSKLHMDSETVGIPTKTAIGNKAIQDMRRVPRESAYSSMDEVLFVFVNTFPASSQRDLNSATTSARIIPIITDL